MLRFFYLKINVFNDSVVAVTQLQKITSALTAFRNSIDKVDFSAFL